MFHYLKKILSETVDIPKGVEKIQDNQECGENSTTSSSSKKSGSNYCLWCWTIICVFYGFLEAVFIVVVFLSLIISLMEPVMEPQCEKIECQLSNDVSSSWGHVSAAASIYHQDKTGTMLVMPCDGIALDEISNEYQIDGAYKLSCSPPVSFNNVASIKTWRADLVGVALCMTIVVSPL
jgi:hypothetical protein